MKRRRRSGYSLLELVVTTSLLGITVGAISLLMRSSVATWDAIESDQTRLDEAHGVVRHFIRSFRQANSVLSITAANDVNGIISLKNVDGKTCTWRRSGTDILYSIDTQTNNTLASNVTELSFVGLMADGVTPTVVPAQIRSVRITVRVSLNRASNAERVIRCVAWLRTKS